MVGRMFREAVENLIDDVKESIEEQGRTSADRRRLPPRPPIPNLELPPDLELRHASELPTNPPEPSTVSNAAAPVVAAPVSAAPVGAAPKPSSTPVETADTAGPDHVTDAGVTPHEPPSDDFDAEVAAPTVPEPAAASLTRLEADCEAARELYRETRAELREARRLARLAARDERRDRRYERRLRSDVDEVD